MKKRIAAVILAASISLSVAGAAPARAAQVYCRVPTAHKVVCYNYTPYRVFINLRVQTSAGPRYFAFWHRYTRWSRYFGATVYNVSWRWHF